MKENSLAAVGRSIPHLRFAHAAGNLGAVETIVAQPATSSHVECTPEERARLGIPEGLIRYSPEIAPPGLLGTVAYRPTTQEEPFYKRLDKEQRLTVKTENRDFKLGGHDGQFVSWFGIVREITTDKAGMVTGLLVENKYSHDMSDMHIQTVSINGDGVVDEVGTIGFSTSAGDAEVLHVLPVTRDQIPALNIVLKRDGQGRTLWSWNLAETGEPGVFSIELGPGAIPKARYTWSKADSRYIGPDGGGNHPFMRLNSAEPFGSKEFDAFVTEKKRN